MVGIEHINSLVQMSVKNVQGDDPELLSSGRIKFVGECRLENSDVFLNNIISKKQTNKKMNELCPQLEMEGLASQREHHMTPFMLARLHVLFLKL